MKKPSNWVCILVAILFLPLILSSQNLVPNCDFDYYSTCPDNHSQFDRASMWYTPTQASSDLCQRCAGEVVGIPNNMWGYQEPYSGSGYGHIISYYQFATPEYREYMQVQLACPLRAGEEYTVEFFVSLSDESKYGIDGMGLHFSEVPLLQDNSMFIDLGGQPVITNPAGNLLTDKNGWTRISGIYMASGNEHYITIGNFLKDEDVMVIDFPGIISTYASYYISHVSVIPVEAWLRLSNDTTLCQGESIFVDAGVGCQAKYLWSDGDTNATKLITMPGNYSVSVAMGCGSISDDFRLDWHPFPQIPIPQDTFLCQGESILLDGGAGFTSYLWQDGSQEPVFLAEVPGIYWLQVIDDRGCTKRDSTVVSQLTVPLVDLGGDLLLCNGDSILLHAGNEGLMADYSWQDNSSLEYFPVKGPGTYRVTVENPCGRASDTIDVIYENCETYIWVPNAFSPDADGDNDRLWVQGVNFNSFTIYVYNRWGELLYESKDMTEGWDGMKSGKPCPPDVYVWVMLYSETAANDGSVKVKKGSVMLLR